MCLMGNGNYGLLKDDYYLVLFMINRCFTNSIDNICKVLSSVCATGGYFMAFNG